jgi:penicillin-binding protein 1A
MEKVLKDPSLAQYRGKFPKPKEDITVPYECQTTYIMAPDSTQHDSTEVSPEGVVETENLNQDVEDLKVEEGDTKTEDITP